MSKLSPFFYRLRNVLERSVSVDFLRIAPNDL